MPTLVPVEIVCFRDVIVIALCGTELGAARQTVSSEPRTHSSMTFSPPVLLAMAAPAMMATTGAGRRTEGRAAWALDNFAILDSSPGNDNPLFDHMIRDARGIFMGRIPALEKIMNSK